MPTYDYRCKKCGKMFEKFQSMSEASLKKCPRAKCGGAVERLIGAGAGLIFKGTGFYQTDYKKSAASPTTKSESKPKESPPASGAKSDKKADKKSESK